MKTILLITLVVLFGILLYLFNEINKIDKYFENRRRAVREWLEDTKNIELYNRFISYLGIDFGTGFIKKPYINDEIKGDLHKITSKYSLDSMSPDDEEVATLVIEFLLGKTKEEIEKISMDMNEAFLYADEKRKSNGWV